MTKHHLSVYVRQSLQHKPPKACVHLLDSTVTVVRC